MIKIFVYLLTVCLILVTTLVVAQSQDVLYKDYVYSDNIMSAQIYINGQPAIAPIIHLKGGANSFTLHFDDLAEDSKDYYYQVIHCNRNWQPSDLDEIEYLDGFNGEEVRNDEYSNLTYVDYVHYSLTLPNEDTRFRISGNYLLIIYEDEELRRPVLSKRFMISEKSAQIYTKMLKVTNVRKSKTHQQLSVEADLGVNNVADPLNDLSIDIMQNNRWDNMLVDEPPKFLTRDRIKFDNTGKLSFAAGKEFRQFDIRSLEYTTPYVKFIELNTDGAEVILQGDLPRQFSNYQDDLDFDGRYVVALHGFVSNFDRKQKLSTAFVNADYANVSFGLKTNNILDDVWVIGSFTDWRLDYRYKMSKTQQGYVLTMPFKQGVYNYLYAKKDEDGKIVYDYVEGNDFRTNNYYTVILYYRDFIEDYDRILSTQQIVSGIKYE